MVYDYFKSKATGEVVYLEAGVLKMGGLQRDSKLGAIILVRELKSKQTLAFLAHEFHKNWSPVNLSPEKV